MISIIGMGKAYGGNPALVEISFSVPPGGNLALLGPSGSGKTTLLRLIAGLEEPDAGEVALGGRTASGPGFLQSPSSRGIGMAFQRPALWPHMTVEENVRFGLRRWEAGTARQRAEEILNRLSLDGLGARYPHQLSGGESQRVSIARAIAPGLPILLLDEPLSHLDPDLAESVLAAVRSEVKSRGTTLLVASHDALSARSLCDTALVLRRGRTVERGALEELRYLAGGRA